MGCAGQTGLIHVGPTLQTTGLKVPPHIAQTQTNSQPFCCLSSDPLGRKVALNTPLLRAAGSTVACTFCACTRCKNRVALVLKTLDWRFMHATVFTFNQNKTLQFQTQTAAYLLVPDTTAHLQRVWWSPCLDGSGLFWQKKGATCWFLLTQKRPYQCFQLSRWRADNMRARFRFNI